MTIDMKDLLKVRPVQLGKAHIVATYDLARETLRRGTLESHVSAAEENVMISLSSYIIGLEDHEIKIHERWPADWWQAFRERWFPSWILARFPVKYVVIDIEQKIYRAVCPHVDCPGESIHFQWFGEQLALIDGEGTGPQKEVVLRNAENGSEIGGEVAGDVARGEGADL